MFALLFRNQDYQGINFYEYFSEPVIQKLIKGNFEKPVGIVIGSLLNTYLYSNTKITHTKEGSEFHMAQRNGTLLFHYSFLKSLHSQPNSFNPSFDCNEVADNDILVITLTNISENEIIPIDTYLATFPQYYGYVFVDTGFSVHCNLFYHYLFKKFIIYKEKIIINQAYSDTNSFLDKLVPKSNQILFSFEEFMALIEESSDFIFTQISQNEITYQSIIKQRSSIYQRLISKIIDYVSKTNPIPLSFEVIPSLSVENITIDPKKLCGYFLNKNHTVGKHKAILFETLLAISQEDWEFLASQFKHGLFFGEPKKIEFDSHGIHFNIIIPVIGNNGKTKDVVTGWIFDNKKEIRLTTAFVEKEDKQSMVAASFFTYYVKEEDVLRFEKIYKIGIKIASERAEAFIPEPLFFKGYEPIENGCCGYAYVLIDGRTKFGKWLKQKNIIEPDMFGKIHIRWKPNSQSYEKNVVFADTFKSILVYNGIDGKIIKYID